MQLALIESKTHPVSLSVVRFARKPAKKTVSKYEGKMIKKGVVRIALPREDRRFVPESVDLNFQK
jgi:hypothetical protein